MRKLLLKLVILSLVVFAIQSCAPNTVIVSLLDTNKIIAIQDQLPAPALKNENFSFSFIRSSDGRRIRYGKSVISEPRGIIVLAPGQSEFIEIYYELVNDFNRNNYDVWIIDWKGQGGSDHIDPDENRALNNFLNDKHDLEKFLREVVVRKDGLPLILLAHSMGAHIALRMLEDTPNLVDLTILTAPMITVKTGMYPHNMSSILASIVVSSGLGRWYAPGNSKWVERPNFKASDNENTSDPVRSMWKEYWRISRPDLRKSYGVTYQWFHNYSHSRDELLQSQKLLLGSSKILMTIPLKDVLVIPEASLELCAKMINCKSIIYENARHELYLEENKVRNVWLSDIFRWIKINN